MAIKIQGDTVIFDDKVFRVGSGTTAERPNVPELGMIRFNTDLDSLEGYDGTEWGPIGGGVAGPSIQSERTVTGTSYTLQAGDEEGIIFFTSNSAITVTIPTNASVPFDQRSTIVLIQQGDGIITVNGASGVAVEGGNISLNKFSALTLYRRETDNQWFVVGGRD